jgi:hypothetical protein
MFMTVSLHVQCGSQGARRRPLPPPEQVWVNDECEFADACRPGLISDEKAYGPLPPQRRLNAAFSCVRSRPP